MVTNIYPNSFSTAAAAAAAGGTLALQNPAAPPLKCPRCDSPNTKFCYYNNYSLAQPRHFCRTCKRYWTRGGTLRDVPVGGGCRKNKRRKKPHLPLSNSLPPPASDLGAVLRGVPQTNLNNLFLPMFESKVGSSNGFHLAHNVQQSAEEGKSFFQAPFLCYDDLPSGICEGLSLIKENPMEDIYSFGGSGSAAAESAYLYSLPDSCSSMIRLL